MTDNTQPEAREFTMSQYASKDDMIGAMRKRIAELESELEAIGAGGVNGPLMGQPQAMPDLSQLTERGAVAWAGVDAQGLREGRWYMVTHDGVATLCEDRRDAEKEAKDADMAWPHSGPHRAVQLVEASTAGFTAADMATASAQGFRDGVASLSANAGEPVAWQYRSLRDNGAWFDCTKERFEMRCTQPEIWETRALYAAPPTAQAEGWMPIAEHDGSACDVQLYCEDSREQFIGFPGPLVGAFQICAFPGGTMSCRPSHWRPLPPPPTSAEGVEHG